MAIGRELLCRGDRCGGKEEAGETTSDPRELRLSGVFSRSRTGVLGPDRIKGSGCSSAASDVFEYVRRRGVCRGRKERGDRGACFLSDRPRLDMICADESVFNVLLVQCGQVQIWSHRSVTTSSPNLPSLRSGGRLSSVWTRLRSSCRPSQRRLVFKVGRRMAECWPT
jgi:hypothetical protein